MVPDLTVLTAAQSRHFRPVDEIAGDESLVHFDLSSEDVEMACEAASCDLAGTYGVRREPWLQEYSERLCSRRSHDGFIRLSRWPLLALSKVFADNREIEAPRVTGERQDRLDCREISWSSELVVEYEAGWLVQGQVRNWEPDTAFAAGEWVLSGIDAFQAIEAGNSGAVVPTWPSGLDSEVLDGDVLWRLRRAAFPPENLVRIWKIQVLRMLRGELEIPYGIQREGDPGGFTTYQREASPWGKLCGRSEVVPMSFERNATARGSRLSRRRGEWVYLVVGDPVTVERVRARIHDLTSEEMAAAPHVGASKRIRISEQDLPPGVSPRTEGRVLLSPPDPEWSPEELSYQGLEIVRITSPPGNLVLEVAG